jgi:hypothetical protein
MKKLTVLNSVVTLSLMLLLFTPQISMAKTYYVDGDHSSASDTNPGTLDLPWLTIQHAAETMVASDSVYIRGGTYNEHVHTEQSGNASGYIVFAAYSGENPIIDGTGVSESQNGIIVDKSYIKLIGLEVRNWSENGIWIENAAFLEISDCAVHDVFYGIGVADGTHDFVFNGVEVHHCDLYGFDVSTSGGADCYSGTFNDCLAHTGRDSDQNVDGFALGHGTQHDFVFNRCKAYDVFDGFDISSRNTTLNRCLAYDCWNGAYKLWQDNVKLVNCIGYNSVGANVELDWDEEPGATMLINCTFFNAQTFTIWIENAADTLHMYNCILAGGDGIGLAFEQRDASSYRGDYNLFHNDNADRSIDVGYEDEFSLNQVESGAWTTYSGQDANSLVTYSATDIFVDPVNFDLHLLEASNALDNATGVGAPLEDYDGNPRPKGEGYDIGAYEYQSPVGVFGDGRNSSNPKTPVLSQNYPNPCNPSTTIQYELPIMANIELIIYNALGQKVRTLVNEIQNAGSKSIDWNGTDNFDIVVDSGIYFYTLQVGNERQTRKMLLIK